MRTLNNTELSMINGGETVCTESVFVDFFGIIQLSNPKPWVVKIAERLSARLGSDKVNVIKTAQCISCPPTTIDIIV
ncbi:MAG: hypothetical protein AAGA27_05040 [Pseudomonadota bacterium]